MLTLFGSNGTPVRADHFYGSLILREILTVVGLIWLTRWMTNLVRICNKVSCGTSLVSSPQSVWLAVGCQERIWGIRIKRNVFLLAAA